MNQAATSHLLKPLPLFPGDTVGIISPAGSLSTARQLELQNGIQSLRQRGFQVKLGEHTLQQHGYLAGTDAQRLQDLHAMFADPQVKAIFCSRGGFGLTRLLAQLDYELLQANPKIFVGYSDLTAFSLAVYEKLRMVTFHGAMAAIELAKQSEANWQNLLQTLQGQPVEWISSELASPLQILSVGSAQGPLLGGCLSVMVNLLGTPFLPDFSGAILLVEDIGEPLYKIDRYFAHLQNAGILQKINGIILGQFVNYQPDDSENPLSLESVIHRYIDDLKIPVVANFAYGHISNKFTIPMGCPVLLDAAAGRIELLQSGVVHARV